MPLAKRNITISLSQGVDTKSDPKQVMPGKLLALENGVLQTADEIRKRNGYTAIPQTITNYQTLINSVLPSSLNSGNFIAKFNAETIVNDGFNLYSQSPSASAWNYKGNSPICSLETNFVVRNTYNQTMQDCAATSTQQMFAWEDSSTGGVILSILDSTTNQVIYGNYAVSSTGQSPKCIAAASLLYCFFYDTNDTHIRYVVWNGTTISSVTDAITDPNATHPNYDIILNGNLIIIAYNSDANGVTVASFDSFMTSGSTISKGAEAATNCITVFNNGDAGGGQSLWIAYNDNTNTRYFIVNAALSATYLAPHTVEAIASVKNITGVAQADTFASTTSAFLFYDVVGSTINGYYINSVIKYNTINFVGTVGTPGFFMRSASLQSRAFLLYYAGSGAKIPHVTVVHDANLQPTYFVAALYNPTSFANFTVVAKIAPALAGSIPVRSMLCNATHIDLPTLNPNILIALLQKDRLFLQSTTTGAVVTNTQTGVIGATLNFSYTNPATLQLGDNIHFGGGYLQMYDGATVCEHGFHLYPESSQITYTPSTSGGFLTQTSTYGVIVLYEWTDNQGQVHQSNPSAAYSVTTGTPGTDVCKIALVIPTLRITAKHNVNIVVYRTGANGTVYYRDNQPSAPLANNLGASTVSYNITQADTTVAANQQLYTTGGEVGNIAAPATTVMCLSQNRIVLIPSEDTLSWWFSKQVLPGSPVEFSNQFVENVDSDAGGLTACIAMDSNLFLFKSTKVYPISGQGPSPSGANNDFSSPTPIATDTGCTTSQSVVLTQAGIMYQSAKGLYLLDRSLNNTYIGAPVEAYNAYTVTSAQLITQYNQVRFTISNDYALVYDYFFKQWYTFTNHSAVSSINTSVIPGDGLFTFLSSIGVVSQEAVGVYTDAGNFIKLKMILSWLSFAGMQGFHRIYELLLLGTYKSSHNLLVQIAYDFQNFYQQQDYINATTLMDQNIYGEDALYGSSSPYGGTNTLYQWRVFLQKQKCEAISVSIEDVQPLGSFTNSQGYTTQLQYGEGYSLSNIALIYGVKDGLYKLPPTSAVG